MSEAGLTLVLGGARSGKSRFAEDLLTRLPAPWLYIATAQALDDEMQARIAHHRARRPDGWETVEVPLDLAPALDAVAQGRPVLIDCLTLWLSNLLLAGRDVEAETDRLAATSASCTALRFAIFALWRSAAASSIAERGSDPGSAIISPRREGPPPSAPPGRRRRRRAD